MSESPEEPQQDPSSKRKHYPSLSSMKPSLVAPGEYHRFDEAETRGGRGPDQVDEAIVLKSAPSLVAPGEYHRFDEAETRGGRGPDQVDEAIVLKSAGMETYGVQRLGLEDWLVEEVLVSIPEMTDLIIEANKGLQSNYPREFRKGVYLLFDQNKKKIAIFKSLPAQEIGASYFSNEECAKREVAAFVLDKGFGGIPPTTMVKIKCGKQRCLTGSMQKYEPNEKWFEGVHSYTVFQLEEFQKMTLIDLRFGNMDRHPDNILQGREGKLIPIDHAECFPRVFPTEYFYKFHWQFSEQSERQYLPDLVEYVKNLDMEEEVKMLKAIDLGEDTVNIFILQHMVLKEGVLSGKTPKEIAEALFDIDVRNKRKTEKLLDKLSVRVKHLLEESKRSTRADDKMEVPQSSRHSIFKAQLLCDKEQMTRPLSIGKEKVQSQRSDDVAEPAEEKEKMTVLKIKENIITNDEMRKMSTRIDDKMEVSQSSRHSIFKARLLADKERMTRPLSTGKEKAQSQRSDDVAEPAEEKEEQ